MRKTEIKKVRCPECGGIMEKLWWLKVIDVALGMTLPVYHCKKCGLKKTMG